MTDHTVNVHASFAGRFSLSIYNPETGETRETGWFDNLITNTGLDHLGDTDGMQGFVRVGTSGTTPANTDTALGAQVGSAARGTRVFANVTSPTPVYRHKGQLLVILLKLAQQLLQQAESCSVVR